MSITLLKAEKDSKDLRHALWEALQEVRIEAFFLRKNVDLVHNAQIRWLIQKAEATKRILQQYQIDSGMTFHGFPKLPEKIRHKIWREALREPQIIAVDQAEYTDGATGRWIKIINTVPTPLAPHLHLLRVNREARSIAQTVLVPYHKRVVGVPAVFANTDIDVMWLIDPAEEKIYGTLDSILQEDVFEIGLQSLLKPQNFQAHVRRIRRLAFSWKMLIPIVDALHNSYKLSAALSCFEKMVQAGVKEIYIVIEDNKAADKPDIVFRRAQGSPQEYFKGWQTMYLKLLHIEAGDGLDAVGDKLQKSFQEIDNEKQDSYLAGYRKIEIPSFNFVDAISSSIGEVPKKWTKDS